MNSRKAAIALSGGVDSAVAASILLDEGYDVFAVMLRLFDEELAGKKSCCSLEAEVRARKIAEKLEIPFHLVDESEYFESKIIEGFVSGYMRGVTPNPCVECNRVIKFGKLLEKSHTLGADYLATGHYARLDRVDGEPVLKMAVDGAKDQSYMLSGVRRSSLGKMLFPLGEITKDETLLRFDELELGVDPGAESQEVCFAGDDGYRSLIRSRIPQAAEPGPLVDSKGETLGMHDGICNFTIGQRRGIGIGASEPLYVLAIEPETKTVVVGRKAELLRRSFRVEDINWLRDPHERSFVCDVKIRYAHTPASAQVTPETSSAVRVVFDQPQSAVTPGQVAAFMRDDTVLGGGTIAREP